MPNPHAVGVAQVFPLFAGPSAIILDGYNDFTREFLMARCDEGYRCDVCGRDVKSMADSDLYLRYVLGEVPLEQLHRAPERHLRCNPAVAQYIVDESFEPVAVEGAFSKEGLDADFVRAEEGRISRAYRRLREMRAGGLSIEEYPL